MKKILFLAIYFSFISAGFAMEQDDVEIHGFLTQGYLKSDENDFIADTHKGTFQFNEMGLNFSKKLTDGLDASIQFFAYDFGPLGKDEITISHASVTAYYKQWLSFRVGKTKVIYGLYGKGRDMDMLRAFILLPQGVYTEAFSEAINSSKGIEIYGSGYPDSLKFLSPIGEFYYHLRYGLVDFKEDLGVSKVISLVTHITSNESSAKPAANFLLGWETPVPGLRLQGQYTKFDFQLSGVTIDDHIWEEAKQSVIDEQYADFPQEYRDEISSHVIVGNRPIFFTGDIALLLYGGEYTWKDLVLSAEAILFMENLDVFLNYQLEDSGNPAPISSVDSFSFKNDTLGYYYMVSYRFTEWFKLGAYYSVHYPNKDHKNEGWGMIKKPDYFGWNKDSCMALQFDLNDNCIFKLEGHYMDGAAQIDYIESLEDYSNSNRYWYLFAAKLSVNF